MPRGDGRLNHDLLPGEKGPQDACGVFGVWAPGEEVAKLTYFGLYALQHRGQESAGIAVSNGSQILVFKDMGLVSQVFDETSLGSLQGHIAVGHARYSTTGASVWENAQPTFRATAHGSIALGHNGNLVNTAELAELVAALPREGGRATQVAATNDTDLVTALLAGQVDEDGKPLTVEQAAPAASCRRSRAPSRSRLHGRAHALRRPRPAGHPPAGPRPPGARLGGGLRDRRPGHRAAPASSARSSPARWSPSTRTACAPRRFAEARPKGCVFEYVYLARPDTDIAGRNVYLSRVEMGRKLAAEAPADADLVIATPESGTPAAVGYAEASGIPYGSGLVKNSYVGRTFIQPCQTIRQLGIRLKLNPLKEVIRGKRLVVVDDSIVRGNTQRALVRMLREAGAAEVHIRISLPADQVALLLRHRLRHPRRADRQRAVASRRSASRWAPTRSRTSPSTA